MFFPSLKRKFHLPTINLQVLCNKRDCNSFFAKDSPRSNPNRSAVHRDVDVFSFEVSSEASTNWRQHVDVDRNGFQCLENKSSQIAGSQFCIKWKLIYIMLSIFFVFSKIESTHIYFFTGYLSSTKKICWFQGESPDHFIFVKAMKVAGSRTHHPCFTDVYRNLPYDVGSEIRRDNHRAYIYIHVKPCN